MTTAVRLYFHFRSPYSWLAVERLARDPLPLDAIPMAGVPASMTPGGTDPSVNRRLSYVIEDVARLAQSLGVTIAFPQPFDTDWIRPNAAFWAARQAGQDFAFLHAAYRARWSQGKDLGDPAVIADVARAIGLDEQKLVAAMEDPSIHETLNGFEADKERDGVCGVPFFVYEGQRFWGQDRIDALRTVLAAE